MALSTQQESRIWQMLGETRGQIGLAAYKDYIFGLMFYKYLCHQIEPILAQYNVTLEDYKQYSPEELDGVAGLMKEELGVFIKPTNLFSTWVEHINNDTFNLEMLQSSFADLKTNIYTGTESGETSAEPVFEGIFDGMRFDSTDLGSNERARINVFISMITMLNSEEFNFSEQDTVSDLYEYLVSKFATVLASDMGQYFTPQQISDLMAKLLITNDVEEKDQYAIYDPTVGSASLLLRLSNYLNPENTRGRLKYWGQEKDATPYRLSRMNLLMHNINFNDIKINHGDTLESDWPDGIIDGQDAPRNFDFVVANPPYSAIWDNKDKNTDPRWSDYGVAPKSKADYAFLLHNLYHLNETGKMAIVLPHGVLFRGAAEGKIRQELIKKHNIETIISLPAKLFLNTQIPVCIIILRKNRVTDDILFVDASNEFVKDKKNNSLSEDNIAKIVETVANRVDVDKYAHLASFDEIVENEYNLNVSRYVDTFEPEPEIPLSSVVSELITVDAEIKEVETLLLSEINQLVATDFDNADDLEQAKQGLNQLLHGGV